MRALHDVSLRVGRGETVGLIGRNGAGKSSTLTCSPGSSRCEAGRAEAGGRVVSLLELGAGFGRDFSGRENIELNGALHGLRREEVEERMDAIIAFCGARRVHRRARAPYSSGMFLRLGFAIAAHLDADVLLIDEVLAVGDEAFQRKCLRRISEQIAGGTTLVLVSHDATAIERVASAWSCSRRARSPTTGRRRTGCSSTTGSWARRRARRSTCAARPGPSARC